MNTHELWQAALGELELKLSKAHFTTWFRSTFIVDYTNNEITVGVPNTFTKAWLEKKYHKDILSAIQNIIDRPVKALTYRVETRATSPQPIVLEVTEEKASEEPENTGYENFGFTTQPQNQVTGNNYALNSGYTFDTFVVGKQNELAYAAAQAVASHPGGTYNPVFIYGDVGLGKTHLLHAIGNEIQKRNPNAKILYASCEHFTNDYINAVRSGKAKEFKDRYRTVDLLLIDDIQFITGKEGTQEEFFHTFNTLHGINKQIVISSDRAPKEIAALEKRLLSRLEWGMLVDVGAPDLETRVAILQIKCQKRQTELDRDILHHIASNIQSNVRELEGALNKIIAYHQFKNIQPTLETVIPIIESFGVGSIKKTVSPKHIIQTVAEYFDIDIGDVLGKSREKRLAFPRQIIMYLLREEMNISYPSIGAELGGRDHTTAMHAYSKIVRVIKEDDQLKRDMELIKQKMYSG
ncbi:chromosomal replication initiator protein DnaA [Candidatus Uhrbacteria bacterium CG_4_9_14_0_2_um_filter_41_50]|uniref:Chromosomal replication initiator protein DnaA n=1 Tax=Candidatus Uhrbacteria bacterium CG_4_9_14_0_2_um_filter_41_50 TaxID=1975031 RepID=A0A2M8EN48_9BACT|nr:MAG: chromosomal replication initiator protein DnaA [Candidatus Uhrbacteria bacterium CG_4_10_14_3_um_filter_41_21]PIZ55192.1 MAG: chromosomal replication initiator protein DnaA [Candidatus Uhrbacteria bacterium CG_4_10_14_0_2_um_filter_41_21]PJB84900.1 MAG: chromosomal replication initiator protein DnaA [Candidatus Uhrbacteria bacterium CG_4_9_14_0_8_um_filter_41_16]PJC24160.1 MAG: chromosomal replication initiator protein DnaA [Candidatus Uhrbacteria bacterium CG_4_9_14_0_2_um_filter_41_50]